MFRPSQSRVSDLGIARGAIRALAAFVVLSGLVLGHPSVSNAQSCTPAACGPTFKYHDFESLAPGTSITAAIAAGPYLEHAGLPDRVTITHADPVRGIATSGWRGRSFSLGIADAVTVLAATAAQADAAATVIANAVDLPGHPAIHRAPAATLQHDTDLGDLPVTTAVGPLAPARQLPRRHPRGDRPGPGRRSRRHGGVPGAGGGERRHQRQHHRA